MLQNSGISGQTLKRLADFSLIPLAIKERAEQVRFGYNDCTYSCLEVPNMTDIAASEELLSAVAAQMVEIGILLNEAISEVVSTSINWHETIAAMRGEICQKAADLACKVDMGPEREFVHAEVQRQVQILFDEILTVIDSWALRIKSPEPSKSGARNLH